MYKISDIYMQKRNSSKRQPALTSSYFYGFLKIVYNFPDQKVKALFI